MALGHEKFTTFHMKFGLYQYMVIPFSFTNAPATLHTEINRMLRPVLGIGLVVYVKVDIDEDNGLVVVAYTTDILITTKRSLSKHHRQVRKVFDMALENNMCVAIDKCVFGQ